MSYQVQLLKGLFKPYSSSYQLRKAEMMSGFWKKFIVLLLLSGLIHGISAYFGINNELLSKELDSITLKEFEAHKILFAAGQVLWGLIVSVMSIYIPALFYWVFTDIEWRKMVVIQLFVLLILLLEKLSQIPISLLLGLPDISSPFSFGIIAQIITKNEFLHELLAQITLFKIWMMVIQYKYIQAMSDRNSKLTVLLVILVNLFFIFVITFFHLLQLEKLL
ncbi:hypothetical protein [Bacillus sp. 03113]|uniref:hypothetical protein n=1 Tax=Bacillus sp. 03113 TaxID=2578211 RepID=UPI001141A173|nr:hypothetical protein [Bacillus sp. 03113]